MSANVWSLQKSSRSKGTYYQAIFGYGRTRERVVTIGYMDDVQAEDALAALRMSGDRLAPTPRVMEFTAADGTRYEDTVGYSDAQIKTFAIDPSKRILAETDKQWGEEHAREVIASGNYLDLPFTDYVHTVWTPVRSREAAEGTVKREAWMWSKILPVIGHVALGRLDGLRIDQFLASRETWSGRTRAVALNTIRTALKYAVECGILADLPKTRTIKESTKRVNGRPVALLPEEVVLVLDAAVSPAHRALYAYAMSTGSRKTESSILDWSDVNWSANTVHVRGTKTEGADRVIPLPPMARRELEALWMSLDRPKIGPAFNYKKRPIGDWKKGFREAAKRAGIERRVYPTLARHTFCTLAAMGGIPKSATKAMMGHSSRSVMVDVAYDNPHPVMVADAMAGFDPMARSRKG